MTRSALEFQFVDPIVRADGKEENRRTVDKSEKNPIAFVDANAPDLLALRLKFLGVQGGMKWIRAE